MLDEILPLNHNALRQRPRRLLGIRYMRRSAQSAEIKVIQARDIRNQADALKANQATAAILAPSRPHLASRLAQCGPKYRCSQSRLCTLCGWTREQRLARRHASRVSRHAGPFRHATLNTYPKSTLTRRMVQGVISAFRNVRQLPTFHRAVMGGVLSVHIVWRRGWRVHIHALLMPRTPSVRTTLTTSWLRSAWSNEGMGHDVQVDPVTPRTERRVVAYGARWQGLPLDAELIHELAWAPRGMTLLRAWGAATALYGRPRARKRQGPKGPT